jgi:hypothetical protein
MPRVTFTRDFDFVLPGGRALVAYRAGTTVLIPAAHHRAAREAARGAGKER